VFCCFVHNKHFFFIFSLFILWHNPNRCALFDGWAFNKTWSQNNVSINRNWLLPEVSPLLPVSSLKVVGALNNYSLVFLIFIIFFGQLKDSVVHNKHFFFIFSLFILWHNPNRCALFDGWAFNKT
jgi:hypothetical protein